LRLGASRVAQKQDVFEDRQKRKSAARPLRILAIVVVVLGLLAAITVPNILSALQRSRQKRSMADMRSVATAAEARATDTNEYPADDGGQHLASHIQKELEPTYIRKAPVLDGWERPFRYYSLDGPPYQSYAVVSAGRDGKFEYDDITKYPMFVVKDGSITVEKKRETKSFDDDIVFFLGEFVQYPEGVQAY
jgi:type II secretion system protein G